MEPEVSFRGAENCLHVVHDSAILSSNDQVFDDVGIVGDVVGHALTAGLNSIYLGNDIVQAFKFFWEVTCTGQTL